MYIQLRYASAGVAEPDFTTAAAAVFFSSLAIVIDAFFCLKQHTLPPFTYQVFIYLMLFIKIELLLPLLRSLMLLK